MISLLFSHYLIFFCFVAGSQVNGTSTNVTNNVSDLSIAPVGFLGKCYWGALKGWVVIMTSKWSICKKQKNTNTQLKTVKRPTEMSVILILVIYIIYMIFTVQSHVMCYVTAIHEHLGPWQKCKHIYWDSLHIMTYVYIYTLNFVIMYKCTIVFCQYFWGLSSELIWVNIYHGNITMITLFL